MNLEPAAGLLELTFHWACRTSLEASVLIGLVFGLQRAWHGMLGVRGRYWLSLLVLVRLLMPAGPTSRLSIFNLAKAWPRQTQESPIQMAANDRMDQLNSSFISAATSKRPLSLRQSGGMAKWSAAVWAGMFWILVGCAVWQHGRLARFLLRLQEVRDPQMIALLNCCRKQTGVRRRVRLVGTNLGSSPALFGWLYPCLLLPAPVRETLDERELRMVFLHELVHVRRGDALLNWVMILAQALHWFNPLIWIALRRLRADREMVCDATVMQILHENERSVYGEALLKLLASVSQRDSSPSLVPVLTHKSEMKRRMTMIARFYSPSRLGSATALAAVGVLCFLTFTRAAAPNSPPTKAPQPKEIKSGSSATNQNLQGLKVRLADLEAQMRAEQQALDHLRVELHVPAEIASGRVASTLDPETVRQLERERISAAARAAQYRALQKQLQDLDPAELSQALPTAVPDTELIRLLSDLNVAESQYQRLRLDCAEEHPKVKTALNDAKTLKKQIAARVEGIMKGLSAQAAAQDAQAEALSRQVSELRQQDSEAAGRFAPYFRAQRDLQILQQVRDQLLQELLQMEYGARPSGRILANPEKNK